ncbi:hypothetical protein H0H87_009961 [Tephrocybe sp. NHM501043]|nr:hypothetical protein H0H87_009961 [Tephrocybe sp. NHM501043]
MAVSDYQPEESDAPLRGVDFPRLEYVFLCCPIGGSHVPRLEAGAGAKVKVLDIDPNFEYYPETYGLDQEAWTEILEAVTVIFPNLEAVTFEDKAKVYPGELERFAKRLPRLEAFDYSSVVESDVLGRAV